MELQMRESALRQPEGLFAAKNKVGPGALARRVCDKEQFRATVSGWRKMFDILGKV